MTLFIYLSKLDLPSDPVQMRTDGMKSKQKTHIHWECLLHSAVLSIHVPHGDANRKAYTRLQGTTRQRMHSIRNVKKPRIHPRPYENNGRFVCEGRGWGRGERGSGSHGTTAQQRMPTLKPNQTPCLLIPFPAPRYPLTVRCLSNPLLIQRRIRLVHRLFLC